MTLKAIGTSSTSKRGTQTWKVTGSSNVYLLNDKSCSYVSSYHYWSISKQSTSYTWKFKGDYEFQADNDTDLYNGNSTNTKTEGTKLFTISSYSTYSWTGTLNKSYLRCYSSTVGGRYKAYTTITTYRVNNTYGWG